MTERDAQREEEIERAKRSGPNLWAWSSLSFWLVENTLEMAALDPIVEGIQPEVGLIEIRRRVAGPAAGGIVPEAALVVVFSALAIPFLAELSKDAYRGFRSALFAGYKKARTWANQRGYAPLAIQIGEEEMGTEAADQPLNIYFAFPTGLDEAEFERAVQALLRDYTEIDRQSKRPGDDYPADYVVMRFEKESSLWTLDYRE